MQKKKHVHNCKLIYSHTYSIKSIEQLLHILIHIDPQFMRHKMMNTIFMRHSTQKLQFKKSQHFWIYINCNNRRWAKPCIEAGRWNGHDDQNYWNVKKIGTCWQKKFISVLWKCHENILQLIVNYWNPLKMLRARFHK